MVEAHGSADHVDALSTASVAQDLVALAELLALELEDARGRRVGLAAQPVALAVGDERQLACGQAPRLGLGGLQPAASGGDGVKPQIALERRQLETERGGELGAAVEGAAQFEEVQRFAERIGGRGPRSGYVVTPSAWHGGSNIQVRTNEHKSRTKIIVSPMSTSYWMNCNDVYPGGTNNDHRDGSHRKHRPQDHRLLLEGGEEVRALGRSPEKLAELDALGAEAVAGDVRDADYLLGTFAGADAVYTLPRSIRLCPTTTPTRTGAARRSLGDSRERCAPCGRPDLARRRARERQRDHRQPAPTGAAAAGA